MLRPFGLYAADNLRPDPQPAAISRWRSPARFLLVIKEVLPTRRVAISNFKAPYTSLAT